MRKSFLACLALAFSGLAACSDLPTAPTSPQADAELSAAGLMGCPRGPGGENCYALPPVSGGPTIPACDPWMDANWCKGDQCIMGVPAVNGPEFSGIASCPIGGGPIGGPDGPGTGGPGTGGQNPPTTVPGDTCNTGEPMVDDPDVFKQFKLLWQASLAQGVETGGWIVRDGPNNYRLIPYQNAVFTPCGVDIFEAPPANLVAMLHTHPWTLTQVHQCNGAMTVYTGTPSPDDVQTLQQLGLSVGYFIDHAGVGKYTPTGGERADRLGRCGY
jgi:hypothetical protein